MLGVITGFVIIALGKWKLVALFYCIVSCYFQCIACIVCLPHGAVGWSAVCNCDIF